MKNKVFLAALCSFVLAFAIEQSPQDQRKFEYHDLDNGLKVLFVVDSTVKDAAAAMRVNVGSSNDPEPFYGLAHFLEHMLFIGSKKYPEVDHLASFVAHHGGMTNAFTAQDHTQYFFSVSPEYFAKAADIFTEFFVEPTLDPAYIDRERHAVDAEFKMHLKNDGWRAYNLSNLTSNPKHPYNRFTIGDLNTLVDADVTLKEALDDFYQRYYVGSNMCFVAVMPKDDDDLKSELLEKLSKINRGTVNKFNTKVSILGEGEKGEVVYVKPLGDLYVLNVDFPITSLRSDYTAPTAMMIAELLGDEGEGSLYACLHQQGLINAINVSETRVSDSQLLMRVMVEMTPLGYEKIDQVISGVTKEIELVKHQGIKQWRFNEQQRIGLLRYLYESNQSAVGQASYYVGALYNYNIDDINKAKYITDIHHFDAAKMKEQLSQMRLSDARITIIAPDVETDQLDPYFGVEYSVKMMTPQQYASWSRSSGCRLLLPSKNPYVPETLPQVTAVDHEVAIAQESQNFRWWTKPDGSFKQPKVMTGLKIYHADEISLKDQICQEVLVAVLNAKLVMKLYPALRAGMSYQLDASQGRILISSTAWSGAKSLAQAVFKELRNVKSQVSEADFVQQKNRMVRAFKSLPLQAPFHTAERAFSDLTSSTRILDKTYIEAFKQLTFDEVMDYADRMFDQMVIEGFEYGVFEQSASESIQSDLVDEVGQVSGSFIKLPQEQVMMLSGETQVDVLTEHNDKVYSRYYQADNTLSDYVASQMIASLIKPKFFESLRTEQQLGYVVYARMASVLRWPFLKFVVQSPHASCQVIDTSIETFIHEQTDWIRSLSDEEFNTTREIFVRNLKHPFTSMSQVFAHYGIEILDGTYDFNIRQQLASAFERLEKKDLLDWWEKYIISDVNRLDIGVNCNDATPTDLASLKEKAHFEDAGVLR